MKCLNNLNSKLKFSWKNENKERSNSAQASLRLDYDLQSSRSFFPFRGPSVGSWLKGSPGSAAFSCSSTYGRGSHTGRLGRLLCGPDSTTTLSPCVQGVWSWPAEPAALSCDFGQITHSLWFSPAYLPQEKLRLYCSSN